MPPVVGLVKFTAVVADPAQSTWLAGWFTCGVGFTVIVKLSGRLTQLMPPLLYVNVTVIVAVTGALPGLVALNERISPVPAATSPMLVLLLVQVNTATPPPAGVVKLILAVGLLLHTVWLGTGLMIGGGFTVIVKVIGVPLHVTPPLV